MSANSMNYALARAFVSFFPNVGVHVTVKSISSVAQKYQGIGCFPHWSSLLANSEARLNGINEWGNVLTFRYFFHNKGMVWCIVSVWWLLVRYFAATAQFVSGGFLLKYSRYHDNRMWSSSFLHFHCSLAWPKISFPLKLPPTWSPLTRDALYEQQLGQLRADCDGDNISHTDTSLEVLKSRVFCVEIL